mmetsp:Transcript_11392/g.15768  ORF Transcript_11392/g.15768 Transcript_11392/m.15768 type:complete len:612 (+) Transcript_11392:134-1969(+)|eukprot:CAMPEP_0185278402 /NCGR_PEP_ID=MMETSP1359-20130426/60976_1 /TAXON_ID=552665 /ORGANISM="Bigelowiella longifila, Strain CCMP242" /LENGTH=611 /DNA_ID=CAMNT_0027872897 /DNA_START=113 /DNA_END=1948 /DNA_ORIENTATION=-
MATHSEATGQMAAASSSSLTIYRPHGDDDEGRWVLGSESSSFGNRQNDITNPVGDDHNLFGPEDIIRISAPDTTASLNRSRSERGSSISYGNNNRRRGSMAKHDDEKELSLVPSSSIQTSSSSSSSMWLGWGYLLMCSAFAATQGSASATIALGVAYAGDLGSTSAGIVFACHTITSLLLAPGVAQRVGGKASLVIGSSLMTLYVLSYFSLHSESEPLYRPLIIVGSLLGGVGTGLIWIAQGVYMTRIVREHSARTGIFAPRISGWAAGIFAAIALGGEVAIKAACTPIDLSTPAFLFLVLGLICAISTMCLLLLKSDLSSVLIERRYKELMQQQREASPLPQAVPATSEEAGGELGPHSDQLEAEEKSWKKIAATINLLRTDSRILMLLPFNLCFGMTLAFLNYFVIGNLAKKTFGAASVGAIAALKPASASFLSLPYSYFIPKVGKRLMMVYASLNYFIVGVVCLVLPQKHLESQVMVVMLCIIAGSGRAVFEGANKGLLTDMFEENIEGAFGNVMFQSGFGATIGFFAYPHMSRTVITGALCGISTLGAFGIIQIIRQQNHRLDSDHAINDGEGVDILRGGGACKMPEQHCRRPSVMQLPPELGAPEM